MSSKTVQVLWAHPRVDSLTASVCCDVVAELNSCGFAVDVIDVYRSGFDPVLQPEDEPDWENLDKRYSDEVMSFIERTRRADGIVVVFPVWWYSMPAALKGFIDRVWNHGTFYGGGRRIGVRSVRWVALAGDTQEKYRKRGYEEMMTRSFNDSIAGYCGMQDSRVELLYNTLGDDVEDWNAHVARLRVQVRSAVWSLVDNIRLGDGADPAGSSVESRSGD